MEKFNNEESIKEVSRPHKSNAGEIIQTLKPSENQIPNRKTFNIKEIASINPGTDQIVALKDIKTNKDGEKYIEINGRKYYEFNGLGTSKNSMYIYKRNSLFIGDKSEGLSIRDGVLFRYSHGLGEYINFEQRKTKYAGGTMHLKEIYKSEILSDSEIIATVKVSGKTVKITKDLIEKYIHGSPNESEITAVETAIKKDANFFAYIQELI